MTDENMGAVINASIFAEILIELQGMGHPLELSFDIIKGINGIELDKDLFKDGVLDEVSLYYTSEFVKMLNKFNLVGIRDLNSVIDIVSSFNRN